MNKKKVLIIDDEAALLKIMGRFLAKLGYEAILVETGPKGLDLFSQDPAGFSDVILDYSLPDLPCDVIISQLRKLSTNVKIILSTGFTATEIQREKQLAVNGTLQKPFTFDDFKKVLEIIN